MVNFNEIKAITIPEGRVVKALENNNILWKTDKLAINTEDMLIKYTGAELHEGLNLKPNNFNGQREAEYFTFKKIPIEPGKKYYCKYGTRSWFFTNDRVDLNSINLRTISPQYTFTAPSNAYYIDISFSYETVGNVDNVFIREVV